MASTVTSRKAGAGALSEDTVEQEYGGDYSEASLEVIRALGPKKGAPFAELDPAERAAALPPSQAECDAAKAQLKAYKQEVDALKNTRLSERERAAIDARRSLMLDVTPEELTWLKMKEYYAAQRAAAAASTAATSASGAASTSASAGAGPDAAAAGDDVTALRAELVRLAMEALGSATDTDELEARAASHLAAATSSSGISGSTGRGGGADAAALAAAADAAVAAVMAGTSSRYREDYLEEDRLTRQVARQRGQRSQAFALSLAAAVGVSVARWWLRRGRGNGGAAAGAGGGSGGPSRSRSTQLMQ
ncbi:hypothetical protein HYH02_008564 [Chlamydomonas schloesseri]|uniref:Uncharacterized protein n=1 Tax=Chlamydomonas schloesseri TaxID=2026947 RepID=A0A835WFN5_9CHLO|nr:hypothetical protein HYH02_008564 [Chlamydomonas schloesseri]|eukprot:KAG2446578.1 hypothetical protein HYH02_008564 [Chlamydomonas schloesseri]